MSAGVGVQRAWDLLHRVLEGPEVRGIAGWLVGEAEEQGDACMGAAALPKGEGRGPANGGRREACPIVSDSQLKQNEADTDRATRAHRALPTQRPQTSPAAASPPAPAPPKMLTGAKQAC